MPFFEAPILHFVKTAINHYLGPFLSDELTVQQLSFQNGLSSIEKVDLNVERLNEILEDLKFPIEVREGYVKTIRFSVPLKTLFQDSVVIEVIGLDVTLRPINRSTPHPTDASLMVDSMSMLSSSIVNTMTHVKEDCLREAEKEQKPSSHSGRDSLANAIDSIFSRIKLTIKDVNIRLETSSPQVGVALEIRAKQIDYYDDQAESAGTSSSEDVSDSPSSGGILGYFTSSPVIKPPQYVPISSYKNITIYGVSLHLDEFSPSRPESPHRDDLDSSGFYPCKDESFHSARQSVRQSFSDSGHHRDRSSPRHEVESSKPVQIASMGGRQSVRFRLTQRSIEGDPHSGDPNGNGPHVEMAITLGVCHFFLAPGQVHALIKLVQGYTGCISCNSSSVIRRPTDTHGYASRPQQPPGIFTENQPMTESDFARCDLSTSPIPAPPPDPDVDLFQSAICDQRGFDQDDVESLASLNSGTINSDFTATATVGAGRHFDPSSSLGQTPSETTYPTHQGSSAASKLYRRNERSLGSSPVSDLTSLKLSLGITTLTLLHEEPRASPAEQALDPNVDAHSKLSGNANAFFQKLGNGLVACDESLEEIRKRLARICTQDHLSLLIKTFNVTSTTKENRRTGMIMADSRLSVKEAEFIEVLFERKNARENTLLLPNDNEPTFMELLVFTRQNNPITDDLPNIVVTWESQKLQTSPQDSIRSGRTRSSLRGTGFHSNASYMSSHRQFDSGSQGRRSSAASSSVLRINLAPFSSEIDPSLVDRINDLLQPSSRFEFDPQHSMQPSHCRSDDVNQSDNQGGEETSPMSVYVNAPSGCVHLRFPIPDLRQDQCRVPWWRRNLRKDFLRFELTSLAGHHTTVYSSTGASSKYELTCTQIIGLYCEHDRHPLLVFRTTDTNSDGNLMDLGHGIALPRITVMVSPVPTSQLTDDRSDDNGDSVGDSLERDLLSTTKVPGSSPFSHKQIFVSDTDKEQIRPGSNKEIEYFQKRASENTRISVNLEFPCLWMNLHDKDVVTALYNRLACDLTLWTPSAPSLSPSNFGPMGDWSSHLTAQSLFNQFQDTIHCMPIISNIEDQMSAFRFKRDDRGDISEDDDSDDKFSSCANTFTGGGGATARNRVSQSDFCFHISVDRLHLGTKLPAKLPDGSVSKDFSGFSTLDVHKGSLFFVSGFEGDPTLAYMAVQLWSVSLEHNGHIDLQDRAMGSESDSSSGSRFFTFPTIQRGESIVLSAAFPHSPLDNPGEPMLSIAMRIVDQSLQTDNSSRSMSGPGRMCGPPKRTMFHKSPGPPQKVTTLAIGISAATLQHRMTPVGEEWITQLMNLVDIPDPPICGYQSTPAVTTTHVFLDRCLIDYKPLNLQARALLAFEELYLSTNAVLETDTTVLNMDAQELTFYLSNKQSDTIDLLGEFVCILEMGMLRLQLTYSEAKTTKQPRFDMSVSNNVAHMRTCADSSSLFIQLVEHLVTFGDLPRDAAIAAVAATMSTSLMTENSSLMEEEVQNPCEVEADSAASEELSDKINSQIADALREDSPDSPPPRRCDDSTSSEDDFVMLDIPPSPNFVPAAQARLQELRELNNQGAVIETGSGSSLRFKEDHFTTQTTIGDFDPLSDPTGMPCPVERYTVREFGLVWHLYAGSDFNTSGSARALIAAGASEPILCDSPKLPRASAVEPASVSIATSEGSVRFSKAHSLSRSDAGQKLGRNMKALGPGTTRNVGFRERGGNGRQLDTCMEFAITKLRFRHSIYAENEYHAVRQVLIVQEVEVRDRLATSNVNQFLYMYSSPERPHFDNEPMILVSLQHVRPELPAQRTQECILRVSVQPVRLNIDQDAVIFLRNYALLTDHYMQNGVSDRRSLSNSSGSSRRSSVSLSSPVGQSPVMQPGGAVMPSSAEARVGAVRFDEMTEGSRSRSRTTEGRSTTEEAEASQPIYFREVIINPTIYIKLDYHGKRLDFGQGTLTAVAAFIAQLSDAELQLKALHCRTGLLGWQKVFDFLYNEWSGDLASRQLPNIFSGVGPMNAVVQFGTGLRDLLWMPVQRYRTDGRVLHGLQLGTRSFSCHTVDAFLTLTVQFTNVFQRLMETSYELMNPGPSFRARYPRLRRPADIREGVTNAAVVLRRGLDVAATDIAAAARGDEDKGIAGTVGGVLRQVAPTALVPIFVTSEAVNNVVGGVRNQLRPDAKREDERKYKN